MNNQKVYYKTLADKMIYSMTKRGLECYYVSTGIEATEKAVSLIKKDSVISWGGSMTLEQIGLLNTLRASNTYKLLDRSTVAPDQMDSFMAQVFCCDTYLMSSNAITIDGKLINIDGNGNRVASLIFGPKQVIVIVGMNKVVQDETSGINRIHNVAAPPNGIRLGRKTPCTETGSCHNCLSPDCLCSHTVITRRCNKPGRIKVILVGENLGY